MRRFCPLASGSSGNSVFFQDNDTKLLIDAGISAKKIKERLFLLDVDISDIDAVLITHEHMDHIEGLKVLYKDIPVICNSETAKGIYNTLLVKPQFKIFSSNEPFEFKNLKFFPFSIQHDTLDPVGYTIETFDNIKFGFCTDLGFVNAIIANILSNCNYLYLEANHQEELVFLSKRAEIYKKRVLSRSGHLSNTQCANLLSKIYNKSLKHVFLAHLSKECNSEERAEKVVKELLKLQDIKINIDVAKADAISKIVNFC